MDKQIIKYFWCCFLIIALLACSNNTMTNKTAELNNLRNSMFNYCSINNSLNKDKDWIIATIDYTNDLNFNNTQNKEILNVVANIFNTCINNILLVNYNTDYKIAYTYNISLINYLNSKNISFKKVNSIFCNVSVNNNNINTNIVHIVFLNSKINEHYFDCVNYTK